VYQTLEDQYSDRSWVSQSDTHEILTFIDEEKGEEEGHTTLSKFANYDMTDSTSLANFFRRPVRIDQFTWLEADVRGVFRTIYPWNLWATNAAVQNKLNNYAFMRGDMHVKVVINCTPFYYGRMIMNYRPRLDKPNTIVAGTANQELILHSQRSHIWLDPATSSGGTLKLPFLIQSNLQRLSLASELSNMGELVFSIFSPLRNAQGLGGVDATVVVYAWFENIELSGATVSYAAQSDEYEASGTISKPASTVARYAQYFERIPIIGPFATATKIGASAVSAIASLFGYTNVPNIKDTDPFRPEPLPKLASSEISYPVEKLTLDPKNELSIDPRIVYDNGGEDEMMISPILQRESYLTQCTWTTANNVDDLLFWSRVNPHLYDITNEASAKLYMTPMAFISYLFGDWRGDIIFKFEIVASKYHKGRLRISFDPSGTLGTNIINTTNHSNIVQTAIVDIGETNSVEFRVPYQQAFQFLNCRSDAYTLANRGWGTNSSPGTYPYDNRFDNGVITLRVLNVLTSPAASSSIDVMVFVKAAPNLELANPVEVDNNHTLSPYAPQSDEYAICPESNVTADNQYKVHFGENIRSLRTLLRRYNLLSFDPYFTARSTGTFSLLWKQFFKMPPSPGYAQYYYNAYNQAGSGSFSYAYVNFVYLTYIMNAFLCYRGSINYSFQLTGAGNRTVHDVSVRKLNQLDSAQVINAGITNVFNANANRSARSFLINSTAGCAGMAASDGTVNPVINVQCPMYSNCKFNYCYPLVGHAPTLDDGAERDAFQYNALIFTLDTDTVVNGNGHSWLKTYVAAGTDFSLHYFINVPTLYIYANYPSGP
jgi:hypothetical protein